jgi:hypothetical protein
VNDPNCFDCQQSWARGGWIRHDGSTWNPSEVPIVEMQAEMFRLRDQIAACEAEKRMLRSALQYAAERDEPVLTAGELLAVESQATWYRDEMSTALARVERTEADVARLTRERELDREELRGLRADRANVLLAIETERRATVTERARAVDICKERADVHDANERDYHLESNIAYRSLERREQDLAAECRALAQAIEGGE